MNKGTVYALWDYEAQNSDELSFHEGDAITILRRKDENETEWWWARLGDREGYVPKNLLGVSTHTGLRHWKSGLVDSFKRHRHSQHGVQFCWHLGRQEHCLQAPPACLYMGKLPSP